MANLPAEATWPPIPCRGRRRSERKSAANLCRVPAGEIEGGGGETRAGERRMRGRGSTAQGTRAWRVHVPNGRVPREGVDPGTSGARAERGRAGAVRERG